MGLIYYIWIRVTGIFIPCLFRKNTGFLCPGCGITAVFINLINLDIYSAYKANSFLFVTLPFLTFEFVFEKRLRKYKWNDMLLSIYIILLLVFGIVRNIM